MADLVGVIPAAGRGVRAYPYTEVIPKSMLEVDGVPLLERNVEILRDQLGVRDVRIVVGHHADVIRGRLGDGARLGVRVTYVQNERLELEMAYSVYLGCREARGPCCVILGDECYVGSDHRRLLGPLAGGAAVVCGLVQADSAKSVRKNYSVEIAEGRIVDMQEKPSVVRGRLMGTGTWLLTPGLVDRYRAAFEPDPAAGPRDWTSWLAERCREGLPVAPCDLGGSYVNVNSRDDLNHANYLVRELTFDRKRRSVVYVVEQEEAVSLEAVRGFVERPEVDEVVVVARRPAPSLAPLAADRRVRILVGDDPAEGVGDMVKRGFDAAEGDLLVLVWNDDTFSPRDVAKILVYLRDADMVVGTRTTRQMIEQGTNMRGLVRAAHLTLAKVLETLWWRFECRFTDVCCVYRGLWRSTYLSIRDNLTARGVEIIPEMVVEVLRARRRIIEIPLNYYNRDLDLTYVASRFQTVGTFARILGMMVRKRLAQPRPPRPPALAVRKTVQSAGSSSR